MVAVVVLASFFPSPSQAAAAPIISDIRVYLSYGNSISINWTTDISTSGKVQLGTSSGAYTQEKVTDTGSATNHSVYISELQFSTQYYYRIVATNQSGQTTYSPEGTFTTTSSTLEIMQIENLGIGPDKAIIGTQSNFPGYHSLRYGTDPNNLDTVVSPASPSHGGDTSGEFTLKNLKPETVYHYQVQVSSIVSEVQTFSTTSVPEIRSIEPTSGPVGTEIKINGQGFGTPAHVQFLTSVYIGCDYGYAASCRGEVVSWTDSTIVARVKTGGQTGPITIHHGSGDVEFFTAKGGNFTLTSGSQVINQNNNSSNSQIVSEKYGCLFSTTLQATNQTVKVGTLFRQGDAKDSHIHDMVVLYQSAWGRAPRCDEIQFHLDHSTPLTTLTKWLADQHITEKFGCQISETVSDAQTLRIAKPLTLGNDDDKYLSSVSSAYLAAWNREPRCDELQFHLDHSTSLERLQTWLAENVPSAESQARLVVVVSFSENGSTISLASEFPRVTDTEQITFSGTTTPNSTILLTVASNPTTYTTRSDAEGSWSFTLPGPLESGSHLVAVDVFDGKGEKISSSEPIGFTVIESIQSATESDESSAPIPLYVWLLICVAVAGLAIYGILRIQRQKSLPR